MVLSSHISRTVGCLKKEIYFKRLIFLVITVLFVVSFYITVLAAPEGGQVVAGQGQISQNNSNTTIQQQSDSLAIDWQGFNIDSHETVSFQQPSSSSVVLNRIFDQNPTQIFGTIEANGRVFLSNPNGLVFGQSATINVGSFVASGLDMNVDDFMQGRYRFSAAEGQAGGIVINRGLITAATGGSVSLIGGAVSNEGVIVANLGQVNLGAGRKAVIDFDGDGLINFAVSENLIENTSDLSTAVNNSGQIKADGGQVLLTATAAQGVFKHVVNNDGIIEAGRIDNSGGLVRLVGIGSDPVIHSGVIDISGRDTQSTGGTVHVLGEKVGLIEKAVIYASGDAGGGTVLIGGDFQGKNPNIQNAVLTFVSKDASIYADALKDGDGGRVIVWADEGTKFYGDIRARGKGSVSEGGFAEVSGKAFLDFSGNVDLSAESGTKGSLLLDPDELNIISGLSGSGSDDGEITDGTPGPADGLFDFGEGNTTSNLTAAKLVEVLEDTNVTLNANTQIDVEVAVDASGAAGNQSLTMDAPTINFSDGANITLNNANLILGVTKDGNVVLLDGATVALSTGGGGGNISIKGSVNGTTGGLLESLTLRSGTGNTTLTGAVGDSVPLGRFVLISAGQTNLGGNITTQGVGGLNLSGASNVNLTAPVILATGDGDISLDGGAVDGNHALTINAGGGQVVLGAMGQGSNTALESLSVTTTDRTFLLGNIKTQGPSGINLSGVSRVDLINDLTLDTSLGNGLVNLSGGSVEGNSGSGAVTINAGSGTVTLGAMGQNTPLVSLTVSTTGQANLGGDITIKNDGSLNLDGINNLNLTGTVTLQTSSSTIIDLPNQGITGGQILTIKTDQDLDFYGGDFNTLTLESGEILHMISGVTTTATGAISLQARTFEIDHTVNSAGGNGTITLIGSGSDNSGNQAGNLKFGLMVGEQGAVLIDGGFEFGTSDKNGSGILDRNELLNLQASNLKLKTIDGRIVLKTAEADLSGFATVTVEANGVNNGEVVISSEDRDSNGNPQNLDLIAQFSDLTVDADNGIRIVGKVETTSGNLVLDADDDNNGTGGFQFDVNGFQNGGLVFAGGLTLKAGESMEISGNFELDGTFVDLGGVAIDSAPAVNAALIVKGGSGEVILGAIGTNRPLNLVSVTTNGRTTLNGDITTNSVLGVVVNNSSQVLLTNNVTIDTSAGNGAINFGATPLDGSFDYTVNAGTGALTLGTVGQTSPLGHLRVTRAGVTHFGGAMNLDALTITSAGVTTLNGNITTSTLNGVDLSGASLVSLNKDVTIDTTFNGGKVHLGNVDGGRTLTIKAGINDVTLGDIGQTSNPLGALEVSGTGVILNGNISTQLGGVDFSGIGAITLGNDVTIDTEAINGNVNLGTAPVNGNENLEIKAGTGIVSVGNMGETTALASLIVGSASRINLSNSTTTFNTLGNINLAAGPLEGNSHLIISAGSGDVSFSAIGQSEALGSLAVTTSGTTTLKGDITTQQVGGLDLSNSANVVLDSSSSITIDTINNNGVVKFDGGFVDGAVDLIINAGGGNVNLNNMGETTALTSLDVNTTGLTTLTGNIKTQGSGGIVMTDATNITLSGTVKLESSASNGKIHLDGGVVDGSATLILDAGIGAVKLGAMGQNTSLTSLSVSVGTLTLGGNVTAQEGIDLSAAVQTSLIDNIVLNSAGNNGDTRLASVDGNFSLTVNTGSGGAALGALGQNDAIAGLTLISSGQTALGGDIKTQGAGGIDLSQALDVDLTTAVVIDTSAGNGPVLLNGGAIDGSFALTVNSGAGDITFDGVGLNSPLASLSITNSGVQSYNDDLFVSGPLTMSGGSIAQNAGLNSTGGPITVEAASDITIAGASNGSEITYTANGGSITQNGDLNSTGGSIVVQAASGITMASAAATLSNGGEITYTAATGDILLGLLDANMGHVTVDTSGGGSILNNRGELIDITGDFSSHMNIKGNVASLRSAERIGISSTDSITLDVPDKVTLAFGAEKAYIRSIQDSIVVVEGAGEVIDVIKDSRDANRRSESAIRQQFPVEASKGSQSQSHLFTVSSPGFGTATEMGSENEIAILNPVVPSMVRTAAGWRFLWDSQEGEGTNIRPVSDLDKKDRGKRSQERQKHDKEIDGQFEEGFKYPIDPFSTKGKGR